MSNSILTLDNIGKSYNGSRAVSALNLTVDPGEIVCLLGPSGSGKTTLLRLVAGLERVDVGCMSINGDVVATPQYHVEPEHRGLGMVFQDYALWPHLKVIDNVGLPLREKGDRSWREIALEALDLVGLLGYEKRYSFELSGGQQQRVALARAIAIRPKLLLFDEPLSNLDAKLRDELRQVIAKSVREAGLAALYITHDQNEALFLADRLGLMRSGELIQIDAPEVLYTTPSDGFVAHFTGAAGPYPISVDDRTLIWGNQHLNFPYSDTFHGNGFLYLRPQALKYVTGGGEGVLQGKVIVSGFAGNGWLTLIEVPNGKLYLNLDRQWPNQQELSFQINWDEVFIFERSHVLK